MNTIDQQLETAYTVEIEIGRAADEMRQASALLDAAEARLQGLRSFGGPLKSSDPASALVAFASQTAKHMSSQAYHTGNDLRQAGEALARIVEDASGATPEQMQTVHRSVLQATAMAGQS